MEIPHKLRLAFEIVIIIPGALKVWYEKKVYNLIDHFGTDISTDLKIFIPQTWQIFLAF